MAEVQDGSSEGVIPRSVVKAGRIEKALGQIIRIVRLEVSDAYQEPDSLTDTDRELYSDFQTRLITIADTAIAGAKALEKDLASVPDDGIAAPEAPEQEQPAVASPVQETNEPNENLFTKLIPLSRMADRGKVDESKDIELYFMNDRTIATGMPESNAEQYVLHKRQLYALNVLLLKRDKPCSIEALSSLGGMPRKYLHLGMKSLGDILKGLTGQDFIHKDTTHKTNPTYHLSPNLVPVDTRTQDLKKKNITASA